MKKLLTLIALIPTLLFGQTTPKWHNVMSAGSTATVTTNVNLSTSGTTSLTSTGLTTIASPTLSVTGNILLGSAKDFFMDLTGVGQTLFRHGTPTTTAYNVLSFANTGMSHTSRISGAAYQTQFNILPASMNITSTYGAFSGITYGANYGAQYTVRSLVDKNYVDSVKTTIGGSQWTTLSATAITYTASSNPLVSVGTTTGTATFNLQGAGTTSASVAFEAKNSSAVNLLRLYNSGHIEAGVGNSLYIGLNNSSATGNFNTGVGFNVFTSLNGGTNNTAMGREAMFSNVSGSNNTAFGDYALRKTTSTNNTGIGYSALSENTSGFYNTALGWNCLITNTTAHFNTGLGATCLQNSTGASNTGVGVSCLQANTTGALNTAIGFGAGDGNNGDNNIFIGAYAGRRQTAVSNKLFIDNQDRGSSANDLTNSLIYGTFDASVANQQLTVNATLKINSAQTTVNASTSGTVTYSQPESGVGYKIIMVHCSAALGTASYTFPVAFTNTPGVVASTTAAAGIVTALSTTAITVTGATTTGDLMIIGY